ncbi:DUF6455 family protein [uncultured Shimia sp.]|uniref:DUF6455 family protein n=1 Tax=uncultured Shimia sp. TaxID=573152 RepID=UPI0034244BC3
MTMPLKNSRPTIQPDRKGRGPTTHQRQSASSARASLNDAVEAVIRCQGCGHSDDCALWLKRVDVATAPPPDHCTNPQLIRRLQEAHG